MRNAKYIGIGLPKPLRAFHVLYRSLHFWTEANSLTHARTLVKALHRDMRRSVRLTNSVTMDNGHLGIGHAGVARAKRGYDTKVQR